MVFHRANVNHGLSDAKALAVSAEDDSVQASNASTLPTSMDIDAAFRDHGDQVFKVLRYLGVPEGAVDDAVQDVFMVVMRNQARYRPDASLRAWILGIATRVRRRPSSAGQSSKVKNRP